MKKFGFIILLVFTFCSKQSDIVSGPYFPKVKSIISNYCLRCHSSTGSWEGRPTQFDTDNQIAASYTSIKASIVDSATFFNKRMPFDGRQLSSNEKEIIIKWYEMGGKITD